MWFHRTSMAQGQSKTIQGAPREENGLRVGIICVFTCAPQRYAAGKGHCVQSSFNFHLIGLAFPDLGSRCTDQPLIRCSWQLKWSLLLIGQRRMDPVTTHICTHLPGHVGGHTRRHDRWRKVVNKGLPKATTEPLLALLTPSIFPCCHLDRWGFPVCEQNSYNGETVGRLQGSCLGNALCICSAETSLLSSFHRWKKHSPRAST